MSETYDPTRGPVYQRAIQIYLKEQPGTSWWYATLATRSKYLDKAVAEILGPNRHLEQS